MQAPTHPEDIKAAIRKRFGSLAKFERESGLPEQSARDVIRGKASRRTAHAIARALHTTVEELFPGRFDLESHIRDNSTEAGTPHRLNAEVR